ncbi:MAG: NADH-quinone oxidoreductase subunit NuoN, partial [Mycobacteriales bacterium]
MILAAAGDITPPSISYQEISPLIVVFATAIMGVLVDAFLPARMRRQAQIVTAVSGFGGAFVAVVALHGTAAVAVSGALAIDGPALFMSGAILLFGLLAVLLLAERSTDSGGGALVADAAVLPGTLGAAALTASRASQTEAYPLLAFSVGGMLMFVQANTLLVMFVALEVMSLPLYLLAGLARRRRLLSQEAAVKYFLLGAFSSAFFLYGLALLYGYAGTVSLGGILAAVHNTLGRSDTLFFLGLALLTVGLLFKIGAAPFHSWVPDVYQGAPTPVTAFMATGTKVAAFGALLRVYYVAFGDSRWDWRPLMWTIAILTMAIGSLLAITQTDVKRMLAYSSVAHAGFILTGLVAANQAGLTGAMFYLVAYGFTTIAAFAIVPLVRDAAGEATHLSQWRGLGRRSPVMAGSFAFLLFALAGIPLTSGFTGKFAVFQAAMQGHAAGLVIVGVIASAVAAFFYARVAVLMFFTQPA